MAPALERWAIVDESVDDHLALVADRLARYAGDALGDGAVGPGGRYHDARQLVRLARGVVDGSQQLALIDAVAPGGARVVASADEMAGKRVTLYVPTALFERAMAELPADFNWSAVLQEGLAAALDARADNGDGAHQVHTPPGE